MKENILPHAHKIIRKNRQKAYGHRSLVLWFTGLSGSGKSTLASGVEEKLFKKGIKTYILDGDNIRAGLNSDLTFSKEDREENIRRIGEVVKLFVDAGIVVLTAFISPYRKDRELVRRLLGNSEFFEIYTKCPVEMCEQRDTKGLYKKARTGKIMDFTGIDSPYEEPENPEIIVQTNLITINQGTEQILNLIYPLIKPNTLYT